MSQRFWWVNFVRGCVALIIGFLIFVWPLALGRLPANFLAMYWLSSGLVGLREDKTLSQKKGLYFCVDLLSMFVGVAILLRPFYVHELNKPDISLTLFGILTVVIGLSHIFLGVVGAYSAHQRSWGSFLQGFFEIGLGVLLAFVNAAESYLRIFAGGWALTGGVLLILQALLIRKKPALLEPSSP